MSIYDYLAAKLREDGYSGVAGYECGCGLDDIAPCGSMSRECHPGYLHVCEEGCPHVASDDECPLGGCRYCGGCVTTTKDWPEAGV